MRPVMLPLMALIAAAPGARAQGQAAPPPPEAYDARLRAAFAAAEAFQGPLDGGWTLTGANGAALFDLRFVDTTDKLEAVWRDLRREGALNASGTVDQVKRHGHEVRLRFHSRSGVEDVVRLSAARGGWSGELTEAGHTRRVRLARASR